MSVEGSAPRDAGGSDRGGAGPGDHGQNEAPGTDRRHQPAPRIETGRLVFAVLLLFGINTMNFYDRQILGAVGESISKEWDLNDRQLNALTIAFILLYAVVG